MSKHTQLPWKGRNDGLIASRVGNVRFVLRIERHGPASTLDDEDRACMDLVLTAVNAHSALVEALKEAVRRIPYLDANLDVIKQCDDAIALAESTEQKGTK